MRTRIPTHVAALAALALAAASAAQPALLSNASADPNTPALAAATISASGVPAPPASAWSEVQSDATGANTLAGLSAHALLAPSPAFRIADDFTVAPGGWRLDRIDLFFYQTGFDGPTSPLAGVTARIWWGPPDQPGSVLLWGDTFTNRLTACEPTDTYRIFNSAAAPAPEIPTPARRIWRATLDLGGLDLGGPSPYWIDWQFTPVDPQFEVFAVPATIAGARETPSANALRLDWRSPTLWQPVLDTGKPATAPDVPLDFAFILRGQGEQPPCPVDWDHNGVVNSTDVAAFINSWFEDQVAGSLVADFDHNGVVNSTDVSEFINVWFASQQGCG
jgi:hypothetical protein